MRIWDIEPKYLCRKHLLAEHRELHGLWNILTIHKGVGGYSHHPETLRWVGKQKALFLRHEKLVEEFSKRGYNHKTPLEKKYISGLSKQTILLNTLKEQIKLLQEKDCKCLLKYVEG
jgi:hypothetical protein